MGWPLPRSRLQLTPPPTIRLLIRNGPLQGPISSSCGSHGAVSGRSWPSAPWSGHKRPKLPVASLLTSLERVEVPTYPQSCNPKQGQGMPEPQEPYPDPESSPFLVSSCAPAPWSVPKFCLSLAFWTALRPWPGLVRAPVRIWLNVTCSSSEPVKNKSIPELFRIPGVWGFQLASWVRHLLRGSTLFPL